MWIVGLMLVVMAAGLVMLAVLALDTGHAPGRRARAARHLRGWRQRRFVDYRKRRSASGRVVDGAGGPGSASASTSESADGLVPALAGAPAERTRETGRLRFQLA
jgi:hypothetical protein